MKNLKNEVSLQEMSMQEMQGVNGGFIPLVIFGVSFCAKTVAGACGAVFIAGMAIGASAAAK